MRVRWMSVTVTTLAMAVAVSSGCGGASSSAAPSGDPVGAPMADVLLPHDLSASGLEDTKGDGRSDDEGASDSAGSEGSSATFPWPTGEIVLPEPVRFEQVGGPLPSALEPVMEKLLAGDLQGAEAAFGAVSKGLLTADPSLDLDSVASGYAMAAMLAGRRGRGEEARKHAAKAIAMADEVPAWSEALRQREPDAAVAQRRVATALSSMARAIVMEGDRLRDEALSVRLPAYQGPTTRERVQAYVDAHVRDFVQRRQKATQEVEKAYLRVLELEPAEPPEWVAYAAHRVGTLKLDFVMQMMSVPVPTSWGASGDVSEAELTALYEQAMRETLEPMVRAAAAAFEACANQGERPGGKGAASSSCRAWLSANPAWARPPKAP